MELSFNQIKKLQVISLTDGKNLGRVIDMSFFYPENKVKGFTVTGGSCFKFMREEQFIPVSQIVKIGEDVILVKLEEKGKPCPPEKPSCPPNPFCPPPKRSDGSRRDMDDYE